MYKMKTKSAAKKRFSKVGGKKGTKFKRSHAFRRHLLTKKSKKRKRDLRETGYIAASDQRNIATLLPY